MKAEDAKTITEAVRANNQHMRDIYEMIRTEAEQGNFITHMKELSVLQLETLKLQGYQVDGINDRNVGLYKISWDK